MQGMSIHSIEANAPNQIIGSLAMLAGFHFWGAFALLYAVNAVLGRRAQAREDRDRLRAMYDRHELR